MDLEISYLDLVNKFNELRNKSIRIRNKFNTLRTKLNELKTKLYIHRSNSSGLITSLVDLRISLINLEIVEWK